MSKIEELMNDISKKEKEFLEDQYPDYNSIEAVEEDCGDDFSTDWVIGRDFYYVADPKSVAEKVHDLMLELIDNPKEDRLRQINNRLTELLDAARSHRNMRQEDLDKAKEVVATWEKIIEVCETEMSKL